MEAIDLIGFKARLRAFVEVIPGLPDVVYAYAATLADYLNDEMFLVGLPLAVALLNNDIAAGKSGYPSVRLSPKLTGMPRVAMATVFLFMPKIVREAANAAGLDGAAFALCLEEH